MFNENCYREVIRNYVSSRKKIDYGYGFQKLARKIRIQAPYFSKIINGKANLSEDQQYILCKEMGLTSEESEYFDLLVRSQRTSIEEQKIELKKKIRVFQQDKLKTHHYIKTEKEQTDLFKSYYQEPIHQIIHIALGLKFYQNHPLKLAKALGLPAESFWKYTNQLEKMNLIIRENDRYQLKSHHLHLPENSPYFDQWLAKIRLLGAAQIEKKTEKDDYQFSVLFSANEKTRKIIQEKFLQFLKEIQEDVKSSSSENLYQMNFDFLSWL